MIFRPGKAPDDAGAEAYELYATGSCEEGNVAGAKEAPRT